LFGTGTFGWTGASYGYGTYAMAAPVMPVQTYAMVPVRTYALAPVTTFASTGDWGWGGYGGDWGGYGYGGGLGLGAASYGTFALAQQPCDCNTIAAAPIRTRALAVRHVAVAPIRHVAAVAPVRRYATVAPIRRVGAVAPIRRAARFY
jgi:hypothetical protein